MKSISDMLETAPKSAVSTSFDSTETAIDMDKIRKYNLSIATPAYGGLLTDQYMLSLFKTQQVFINEGINFRITTLRNESLITRARNILVAMFLHSDCSHLLFIDADIEFDTESIIRMLAIDKDIVCGAYPKKVLPIDLAINFKFIDSQHTKVNVENGAVEVLDASTGFMLIKRRVFERLIIAHPELHYKNDSSIDPVFEPHTFAFFDTMIDPEDRRYLSEDYAFIRLCQKLDPPIKVWVDPKTELNHIGCYTFKSNISEIFKELNK